MSCLRATVETRTETPGVVVSALSYVAVLLPFAWPWLRVATHAFPGGALLVDPSNGPLIAWVLGWVASAVTTAGVSLFDAPVSYPAPAQLTGTDHLLSSQIVFLPVYALTGNALLGANLLALVSYPLAALSMQRLLLALGCAAGVAWVGGLAFALGPLRVPGNLQIVQYQNLFLPWVALLLTRLRQRPSVRSVLLFGCGLALGIFSSYYLAVMLGVVLLAWGYVEYRRPDSGAARFALLTAASTVVVVALLTLVSAPYFERPEATGQGGGLAVMREYLHNRHIPGVAEMGEFMRARFQYTGPDSLRTAGFLYQVALGVLSILVVGWFGVIPLALAGAGLVALRAPCGAARTAARRGLLVFAIAFPLAFLPVQVLANYPGDSFLALFLAAPLRVFRLPYRFFVLAGFGTALLTAAALQLLGTRFGGKSGLVASALAAVALLVSRGPLLSGTVLHAPTAQTAPIYDAVREVGLTEPGPLLELPLHDRTGITLEREAMLGSLRHGLPLLSGKLGYPARHRPLFDEAVAALPNAEGLDRLVDLAHLHWLLLRPAVDWAQPEARARLLSLDGVAPVVERDGWVLARVSRQPRHAEWYTAIVAGGVPDVPRLDLLDQN